MKLHVTYLIIEIKTQQILHQPLEELQKQGYVIGKDIEIRPVYS